MCMPIRSLQVSRCLQLYVVVILDSLRGPRCLPWRMSLTFKKHDFTTDGGNHTLGDSMSDVTNSSQHV